VTTQRSPGSKRLLLIVFGLIVAAGVFAACGGGDDASTSQTGIRLATPTDAAALLDDGVIQPVVLDVRTPEEFGEGHLEGAVLIDFYGNDFKDTLSELDRDLPYVIYCRSGNRSGQTREIMTDLGFTDVVDIDGGITAWQADGLPTVG